MNDHMPELGQWAFSNSEFLEAPVSELFTAALVALAGEISRVMWNSTQEEFHIGSNYGEQFIAPVFEMRDYCWCDGELAGHENACPPNFQWRDVKVNWYKHMGRGMSANRDVPPEEIAEMLVECLEAVRGMEKL